MFGVKNIFLDIGLRLIVGAVFLIAGISKIPMQPEWVEAIIAFKILPLPLARAYASVLPWLEITIGACLILGLFTRVFSMVSIPIIASFVVANAWILSFGGGGECPSCFGELVTMDNKVALVIDVLLLIGALLIFFQRKHFMALDSRLRHFIRKP